MLAWDIARTRRSVNVKVKVDVVEAGRAAPSDFNFFEGTNTTFYVADTGSLSLLLHVS